MTDFKIINFYTKCPNCGEETQVNLEQLDIYPPINHYVYHCSHCNCSALVDEKDIYSKLDITEEQLCVSCMICGKAVPIQSVNQIAVVCDECKDAIKKLKEWLENEKN